MAAHTLDDHTQEPVRTRLRLWRARTEVVDGDQPGACVRQRSGLLSSRPCRFALGVAGALGFVVFLALASAAVFWARLGSGPIYFEGLGPKIAAALSERIGGDFTVNVGPTIVGRGARGPALSIDGFSIVSSNGQVVVAAPRAEVDVDAFGLLFGKVTPARLELIGLELRLLMLANGSVAISAGDQPIVLTRPKEPASDPAPGEPAPTPETPAAKPAAANPDEIKLLAAALRDIFDLVTSPSSPLAALEKFGVHEARLILDDRLNDRSTTFEKQDIDFARTGDHATIRLATDGLAGRWQVAASAVGSPGARRGLKVDLIDIAMVDIAALTGRRNLGVDFDMPISLHLDFTLGEDGALAEASGRFGLGAGYIYLNDPDAEPFQIDEINGAAKWNVAAGRLDIDQAQVFSDQTQLTLSGSLSPVPEDESWLIELHGSPEDVIGGDRPGDKPISISHLLVSARLSPAARKLAIEKLEVAGPYVSLAFAIDVGWDEAAPYLKMRGAAGRMGARELIRLWPASVAAATRGWFIDHLHGGIVEGAKLFIDFDSDAFTAMGSDHAVPDQATLLEFDLTESAISFLPGVPNLTGIDGSGRVTGKTATFNATRGSLDMGRGRKLALSELSFNIPDLEPHKARATINGRAVGGLDAVADLLSRESLKGFGGLPIDPAVAHGKADGHVTVDLKLDKNAPGEPTSVKVAATITNFTFDNLIGKEKLDQGTLNVTADKNGLRATGQGRVFGSPATIELKRQGTGPAESTISVQLDDAARTRQGWPSAPQLAGMVTAKFTADLSKPDISKAQVEVDLTRAAMDGPLPGYSKPAGRPAKLNFIVAGDGDGAKLDSFSFDGGSGVVAAGTVNLDANGGFASAKFSQVRMSPGDDMRVDVEQAKDLTRLVVRATSIDIRPFLRRATGAEATSPRESGPPRDIDLDLKSTLLTGNNRQAIANAEVKIVGHGVAIRQFSLNGRIGRAQISGQTNRSPGGGAPIITLSTMDGGALLSFLDLYRRMEGGNLSMTGQVQGDRIDGSIHVLDFVVRDEPGLRRLVTEGAGQRDTTSGRIDTSVVHFTKMQVGFSRSPSRLDLRDGVIYGTEIGLSVDGVIDYARDRVALTGTFVPAYGLNNLFSQIPLVGPIISGGSHEGLFAVNFQISGAASAPVLNINPLSAIAPGFLRKIFGAGIPRSPAPPATIPQPTPQMPMTINPVR